MEFEYKEIFKYPTYVVLNLTDNCNLACRYCFVQQKPHYMTLDIAKQAVSFIIHNYNIKKEKNLLKKDEKKTIIFFGGEPMLMFDSIIKPLVEYIDNNYHLKEFSFHITTNGTLFTEERIEFLKKYNIIPLLSIDGDRTTQEYNRPCKNCNESSFDLIEKNIPFLLKHFPNIVFRSTVYKDSINNLYNDFLYAESMGFRYYTCIPDVRSQNWTQEDLDNYEKELIKISYHILQQFLEEKEPKIIFNNLYKSISDVVLHDKHIRNNHLNNWELTFGILRCGLGTTTCSINYKGEIFSCQEQDTRKENGNYFYIGNLDEGINESLHSRIIIDYMNSDGKCEKPEECILCPLENECNHGCPSVQKDLFNDIGKVSYINCKTSQLTFNIARAVMKILVEKNNQIFYKILNNAINTIYT